MLPNHDSLIFFFIVSCKSCEVKDCFVAILASHCLLTGHYFFALQMKPARSIYLKAAGLKCRSLVTGQVTGHRPQARSQVRPQATGPVTGQTTGHRSGHTSDHRSHTKTIGHWTKLFLIDILLYKNRTSQGTSIIFFLS